MEQLLVGRGVLEVSAPILGKSWSITERALRQEQER